MIVRILHGRLGIRILSYRVENLSLFAYPRTHVICCLSQFSKKASPTLRSKSEVRAITTIDLTLCFIFTFFIISQFFTVAVTSFHHCLFKVAA